MKVAVTGASGFIGRALCSRLSSAGHEVIPLSREETKLQGAAAVVHLAGIAHRRADSEELERVNIGLARQVGECAAAGGASFVFLSSVKVHGEISPVPFREDSPFCPGDRYAESKLRAEDALRSIPGLRLVILRPPLVYGPDVRANFLALMSAVARGVPLPLASVRNRRSLIYVGNLVDAVLRCLGRSGTFLLSDGPAPSVAGLCQALGAALGRPARLFPFPPRFLPRRLGASLEVDDSTARRVLGWQPPFSQADGLSATAAWYQGR